jgi:uncharacterized protein
MKLTDRVASEMIAAMKQRDIPRLSILRVVKSELQRLEQSSGGKVELTDVDVIKVVKKLIEGVKETTQNQVEINILSSYLPKQLTEEEIKNIIGLLSVKDMGAIMKHFKNNFDGQYDGKTLSSIIKTNI